MAWLYVLYVLKIKRRLQNNPVSKLYCYAIRSLFINGSIHSGYIFVMIENALWRFNHNYMDPSFPLIILHSAS